MNCNEAVAALVASLESGVPMTAEQREHIRTCERCRELLDSAKQFQTLLGGNGIEPPAVDAAAVAAEQEVLRAKTRRTVGIAFAVAVVAWVGLSLLLIRAGGLAPVEGFLVAGGGIGVVFLLATPLLLLVLLARAARTAEKRWYKRLKPGRQLSGVCLGLAERFGWNVTMVRLAFLAALFFHGLGFWVYVVLDLAMPVHPDDRQFMLRFRWRRWLARRSAEFDRS
ncbi:MAG TPA: PspC domain-containing protein [Thermoanaerobaculia bacterium]|nr:PspC domain-containing protein [Thermoanaerobaculia bacterium]